MKDYILSAFSLVIISCGIPSKDIKKLEGFWEIQSVQTDGQISKSFKASTNIDHYAFRDSLTGVYRKVIPQFDGQFKATTHYNDFIISQERGNWWINQYNFDQVYRMKIITLEDNKLILRKDSTETDYIFKRFEPFNMDTL